MNSSDTIADLRLLALAAYQRAAVVPSHDQVLASGWELSRFHNGCPVWRRDTPGGMAFVMHDREGWFAVVGTTEHSARQYATRQEACGAADAVLDGQTVSL